MRPFDAARRGGALDAGLSLVELVVVICIVAVLAGVLLGRLHGLQAEAERASVEHVIGALRSALALQVADAVAEGREGELARLAGSDPMEQLAETPANYLGALDGPDPAAVRPGHWYFDRNRRLLVYRVRHADFLETSLSGPPRLRLKIVSPPTDYARSRNFQSGRNEIPGLSVRAVEPYRWLHPRAGKE